MNFNFWFVEEFFSLKFKEKDTFFFFFSYFLYNLKCQEIFLFLLIFTDVNFFFLIMSLTPRVVHLLLIKCRAYMIEIWAGFTMRIYTTFWFISRTVSNSTRILTSKTVIFLLLIHECVRYRNIPRPIKTLFFLFLLNKFPVRRTMVPP